MGAPSSLKWLPVLTPQENCVKFSPALFIIVLKTEIFIKSCSPIKSKIYCVQSFQCLHFLRQGCQNIVPVIKERQTTSTKLTGLAENPQISYTVWGQFTTS